MHLLIITAWIVGGMFGVLAIPWLVLGAAVMYFNLFRRGAEMAWYDWPFFLAMVTAGALINVTTLWIVFLVNRVTGIGILGADRFEGARASEPRRPF